MNLKNTLKNSWKALPVVSFASILGTYGIVSILMGTPNPKTWHDKSKEIQGYNRLYNQAVKCIEKDGVYGLSLNEVGELYSRAGIDFKVPEMRGFKKGFNLRGNLMYGNFYRPDARFDGPELKKAHLEKVVKSCETGEEK